MVFFINSTFIRSASRDDSYEEVGLYENIQDLQQQLRRRASLSSEDEEVEGRAVEAVIEQQGPGKANQLALYKQCIDVLSMFVLSKGQCVALPML